MWDAPFDGLSNAIVELEDEIPRFKFFGGLLEKTKKRIIEMESCFPNQYHIPVLKQGQSGKVDRDFHS